MTSELSAPYSEAFVWVWLPRETEPVVAGRLSKSGARLIFNYGRSYLARPNAIALHETELPLQEGILPLLPGLTMPGCIRDASPDAWGRRVLMSRRLKTVGQPSVPSLDLDELSCLLESGSDRTGALDFQRSPSVYEPRQAQAASLQDLMRAASRIEQGTPLPLELQEALLHGTSLGGARPKALIDDRDKKYIAKFSSSADLFPVVKAEYVAMRLAARAGLNVASVSLRRTMGKDVLLVQRFDRERREGGWSRRAMISALTLQQLDEMMARYASYEKLAEIIRLRAADAKAGLRELFSRMVFNVLCGNTDDHARNHSVFWDGKSLDLTPAYDICPQSRTGEEATQAMLIAGNDRSSRIVSCIAAAPSFLLRRPEAIQIVRRQIDIIKSEWDSICDDAGLSQVDRMQFWRRQFLNPYAFVDAPAEWGLN